MENLLENLIIKFVNCITIFFQVIFLIFITAFALIGIGFSTIFFKIVKRQKNEKNS